MPFNGSGVYTPPSPPTFPAVTGTKIRSSYFNAIINDLSAGLSNCLTRDGQSTVTDHLALNGFRLQGVGDATSDDDAAVFGQVKTQARGTYATITGLTNSNVVLTAAQYDARIIRLSGTLTANIVLFFPALPGEWIIDNRTTGAFTIECRIGAGPGVIVSQAFPSIIFSNGSAVYSTLAEVGVLDARYAPLGQVPTGTLLHVHAATAPAGTVEARGDYTLGSTVSGATYTSGVTALYSLMWANLENAIYTSGGSVTVRGASASADFSANKRIAITEARAVVARGLDNGLGVDVGRVLASQQLDAFQGHEHEIPDVANCDGGSYQGGGNTPTTRQSNQIIEKSGYGVPRYANETRMRNVALLAVWKL